MRQAPHVPKLHHDPAAVIVHGSRNRLPRFDLADVPKAGRIWKAEALRTNPGSFGDNQTRAGTLAVVIRHDRGRNVVSRASAASHGRHEDAVWRRDSAKPDRIKQCWHQSLAIDTSYSPSGFRTQPPTPPLTCAP